MSEALFEEIDLPESESAPVPAPLPEAAVEPVPEAPPVEAPAAQVKPEEPAAAEAVAPAPAAAVPAPAKEPERVVPLATLLDERRRFEARIKEIMDKSSVPAPAKTEPEPQIEYGDDPKGYIDSQVQKALHQLDQLKKEGTETIEQVAARTSELQLSSAIDAAESAAAAEAPDFREALAHVRQIRLQQLQLANPEATREQLVAHIGSEERAMAATELARGRNPYLIAYQVAKTVGYTPSAAKPAAVALPNAVKPNGATPTLSPDLTLGKTGGSAPDAAQADEGEEDDVLTAAFSERFGRKRA